MEGAGVWKREVKAAKARLDDGIDVGENCLLSSIAVAMDSDEREREGKALIRN